MCSAELCWCPWKYCKVTIILQLITFLADSEHFHFEHSFSLNDIEKNVGACGFRDMYIFRHFITFLSCKSYYFSEGKWCKKRWKYVASVCHSTCWHSSSYLNYIYVYKSRFHKVVKNDLLQQWQIKHEKIINIYSTNKIAFTITKQHKSVSLFQNQWYKN